MPSGTKIVFLRSGGKNSLRGNDEELSVPLLREGKVVGTSARRQEICGLRSGSARVPPKPRRRERSYGNSMQWGNTMQDSSRVQSTTPVR